MFCSTFFALWLAAAASNVQQIDEPALRALAEFPHLNVEQGYVFHATPFRGEGEYVMGSMAVVNAPRKVDRAEVAQLRASLKHDLADALRYAALGEMLEDLGEDPKDARKTAADLFRQSIKAGRPINVPRFASVLAQSDGEKEAEQLLKEDLKKNPGAWREWAQLSFLEINLAIEELGMTNMNVNLMNYDDALAKLRRAHPTEPQVARARTRLDESKRCTEKTVSAAPEEPSVYIFKAGITLLQRRMDWLLVAKEVSAAEAARDMVMNDIADDVERVAKLRPNDVSASATVAYYLVGQIGPSAWDPVDGIRLPSKQKAQVENALAKLDELSKSANAPTAAASLSALGYLDFFFKNNPWAAEQKFRRAVELDPASEEGWQGLIGVFGVTGRFSKLKSLAEERLKVHETPANYILLAKACAKLNEPDESERAIKKAVDLDPSDPLANLGLAALQLAQPEKSLTDISRILALAERGAFKLTEAQRIDLEVVLGINLALQGKPTEARAKWTHVLQHDPGNETAKRALALVK